MNFIEELEKMAQEKTSFHNLSFILRETEEMDEDEKKKLGYEKVALSFCSDINENDYYGPFVSGKNPDGTDFSFPNKSMITKEVLDYWRERAKTTTNPMLKLRYIGLEIEFRSIVGDKANGQDRFDYIDSIVETIEKDLFEHPIEGFQHLERAMKIANSTKNHDYIEKVKNALINYDLKYSTDETPGLYSFLVLTLKNYPGAFDIKEKEDIESKLNQRYKRLYQTDKYFLLNECVELLVDYYGVKDKEKVLNILRQFENKTLSMKDDLGSMRTQIYLHKINQHYFTMSSKEDQERVNVKISQLGPDVLKSLSPVEIPLSEEMRKYIDQANEELTTGSLDERLLKFIGSYWHHKDEDQANADRQKKNSLMGLFATIVYDQTGRMTTVSSSSEDNDKGAVEHFRTFAPMMAYVHHPALLQDIKDDIIGKKTVLDIIRNCPSFYPDSMTLIEKALDAYYANDYLQFMHLIIPQIERAYRNFVGMRGESTYSNRDIRGGYSFLTFEGVLRSKSITDIENGDLAYHLMAVFTDNHGLNLRNDVMHGMAPMAYFSYQYADIVFHSLILVATLMQ